MSYRQNCHASTHAMPSAGFTLIELMITVAIVAILSAIAYPSYQRYVVASHRTDMQAAMVSLAQYMERKYSSSFAYPAAADIPASLKSPDNITPFYTVTVTSTGQSFTISAAPKTSQNDSTCGTLTLNEKGEKTPSTSGCWK